MQEREIKKGEKHNEREREGERKEGNGMRERERNSHRTAPPLSGHWIEDGVRG